MSVHNQIASMVNLARLELSKIDRAQVETRIPSATLELLLRTLIDLGAPPHQQQTADRAMRAVAEHLTAYEEAREEAKVMSEQNNGGL